MLYTKSLILSASGYLIGFFCWVILGGFVIPIISGFSFERVVSAAAALMFIHAVPGALNFFLIPIYFFVFMFYEYFSEKHIWIKTSVMGVLISCLIFVTPFVFFNQLMFGSIISWKFINSVFGLNAFLTLSAAFFIPQVLIKKNAKLKKVV